MARATPAMAATLSSPLATPPLLLNPKPPFLPSSNASFSPLTLSTHSLSSHRGAISLQSRPRIPTPGAAAIDSPAAAADTAGDIVSATADSSGDGVSTIISLLLFVAFVGLSVLTVGVIYLGVTDFLQKRERDKLEKEEAANRKKRGGKRGRVRARTGPRGFGQKIDSSDEDD